MDPVAWFDPDFGVARDASGRVYAWESRVKRFAVYQATAAKRPGVGLLNGRNSIVYTRGEGTCLRDTTNLAPVWSGTDVPFTVISVNWAIDNTNQFVFDFGKAASPDDVNFKLVRQPTGAGSATLQRQHVNATYNTSVIMTGIPTKAAGWAPAIDICTYSNGVISLFENGKKQQTVSAGFPAVTYDFFEMGIYYGSTYSKGNSGDVILWRRELSFPEQKTVHDYLMRKYQVPSNFVMR